MTLNKLIETLQRVRAHNPDAGDADVVMLPHPAMDYVSAEWVTFINANTEGPAFVEISNQ